MRNRSHFSRQVNCSKKGFWLLVSLLFFGPTGFAQKVKKQVVDYVGPLHWHRRRGQCHHRSLLPYSMVLSTRRLNKIIQIDERNL
jgi:hypothetical protein